MVAGDRHIRQDVDDISSADQLISYATAGQLAYLRSYRPDLSQAKLAYAAGLGARRADAGAVLSTALKRGPTAAQLAKLDEAIGAMTPELDYTGGLCSLAQRLAVGRRDRLRGGRTAYAPASWTGEILKDPSPPNVPGVLIQASALLSAFEAADRMDASGRSLAEVRDRYREELALLARRLILISMGPPTPRTAGAVIMLGDLASYAFEPIKQRLEHELRFSPLGFRLWQVITWLVKLGPARNENTDSLRSWTRRLVRDSEELRKTSLDAATGFDLELATAIPAAWSPPEDDWAGHALFTRARNNEASVRERGTAAMALWERAIRDERRGLDQTESDLRGLIAEFRHPDTRPDAAAGLRWVAATLEENIGKRMPVCNEWPDVSEPWLRHVEDAANELDNSEIPEHLRAGAKKLLQHAILQNASVYRRRAIDTIVTSGWNEPIARALGRLLRSEREESWLRIRVLTTLGSLQRHDYSVEADLTQACELAHANLCLTQGEPPRAHISEMHASLFAVGDCFGPVEDRARSARDALHNVINDLATVKHDRAIILHRPARAMAYLLTVSAQPRQDHDKDFSQEVLEQLSIYPDAVTSQLSKWALSFRFADDGSVRPLLAAVEGPD